jgi:hypothetical protein
MQPASSLTKDDLDRNADRKTEFAGATLISGDFGKALCAGRRQPCAGTCLETIPAARFREMVGSLAESWNFALGGVFESLRKWVGARMSGQCLQSSHPWRVAPSTTSM